MIINFEQSIVEIVVAHAKVAPEKTALVFDLGSGPVKRLSYSQLAEQVRRLTGALFEQGLSGRHVGLLFSPGIEFVLALLACLGAGSVAVPIAPIGRRHTRVHNIAELVAAGNVDCLLLDDSIAGLFGAELIEALQPVGVRCIEFGALQGSEAADPISVEADRLAVLQFTSGTISKPKGVMITHGNVIANEVIIRDAFGHDENSHFVGWVPHYHDQGLFGNIIQPLFLGSTCVLTSPSAFVTRPILWLELISSYGAHTSGGPNFGFDLCTNYALRRGLPELDLSSWRVAFNGAERVRPKTLRRFAECFKDAGFDERAFLPCYGLAECTLVTVAMPHWTAPIIKGRDVSALALGSAIETTDESGGLEFVCCGSAMAGSEAIVVDTQTRQTLPHDEVGEIWLRGPHIAAGYWNDPAKTDETFGARLASGEGPFMRTGDLAFSGPEGLYIVGRIKDLIVLHGRNYAPSDVEQIWSELVGEGGETRSAAVQIDIDEDQHVVLIAEVNRLDARKISDADIQKMAQDLRAAAMETLELGVTDLVIVAEGAVPRTTSGKVQRRKIAEMLLQGTVTAVGVAGPLASMVPRLQKRPVTVTP